MEMEEMPSIAEQLWGKVKYYGRSGGFEILESINSTIGKYSDLPGLRTRISSFLTNTPETLREFDPQIISEILMLIREMLDREEESISYLLQRLQSARPLFVGYVCMLLGWFGPKADVALPGLTQLVIEGIVGNRWAAEAIVRIGVPPKFLFVKLKEQADQGDTAAFTQVLALIFEVGQQHSNEIYEIMDDASRNSDKEMRSELASFLLDLESEDMTRFKPIRERLRNDPDESVRRVANMDIGTIF